MYYECNIHLSTDKKKTIMQTILKHISKWIMRTRGIMWNYAHFLDTLLANGKIKLKLRVVANQIIFQHPGEMVFARKEEKN